MPAPSRDTMQHKPRHPHPGNSRSPVISPQRKKHVQKEIMLGARHLLPVSTFRLLNANIHKNGRQKEREPQLYRMTHICIDVTSDRRHFAQLLHHYLTHQRIALRR